MCTTCDYGKMVVASSATNSFPIMACTSLPDKQICEEFEELLDMGNCVVVNPEDFFEEKNKEVISKTLKVCTTCSIIETCKQYASSKPGLWGTWGGTTRLERKRARLKSRRQNKGEPIEL